MWKNHSILDTWLKKNNLAYSEWEFEYIVTEQKSVFVGTFNNYKEVYYIDFHTKEDWYWDMGDSNFKITCKYCGEENFKWISEAGKFKLVDSKGKQHTCKKDSFVKSSVEGESPVATALAKGMDLAKEASFIGKATGGLSDVMKELASSTAGSEEAMKEFIETPVPTLKKATLKKKSKKAVELPFKPKNTEVIDMQTCY